VLSEQEEDVEQPPNTINSSLKWASTVKLFSASWITSKKRVEEARGA